MSECEKWCKKENFASIFYPYDVEFKHEGCDSLWCWYLDERLSSTFPRQDTLVYRYRLSENGRSILGNECCAEHNFVYVTSKLKIAKIVHVNIHPDLRNRGILRRFFNNGLEVFKKKGYSIITLDAIGDGILVWPRLGFRYVDKVDEMQIKMYLKEYLVKVRGIKPPDRIDLATIERHTLEDEKMNFLDYFLQKKEEAKKGSSKNAIKMYYAVEPTSLLQKKEIV